MSAAKRELEARRLLRKRKRRQPARREEVFAAMRCDVLLARVCGLSDVAFRAWWILQSRWKPGKERVEDGCAVMGYRHISYPMGERHAGAQERPGSKTIATALDELCASGAAVLLRQGSRPNHAGGGRRLAAVWGLPCRSGAPIRPELPSGLRRPEGKVRIHVMRMRELAERLSGAALRVLAFALAVGDRTRDGELTKAEPFPLPARSLAACLCMGASTASAALRELCRKEWLVMADGGRGRRPATFNLAPVFARFRQAADAPAPRV